MLLSFQGKDIANLGS